MQLIHTFGEDGCYISSAEQFIDPVTNQPADINTEIATDLELPVFDPTKELPYFIDGKWEVRKSNEYEDMLRNQLLEAKLIKKQELYHYRSLLEREGEVFNGIKIPLAKFFLLDIEFCLKAKDAFERTFSLQTPNGWVKLHGSMLESIHCLIIDKILKFNEIHCEYERKIDALTDIDQVKAFDFSEGW